MNEQLLDLYRQYRAKGCRPDTALRAARGKLYPIRPPLDWKDDRGHLVAQWRQAGWRFVARTETDPYSSPQEMCLGRFSHLDAARRAFLHDDRWGLTLERVEVSSMAPPEDTRRGGVVYVANGTRTYFIEHGRVARAHPPEAGTGQRSRRFPQRADRSRGYPRQGHRRRQAPPKQKG